MHKQTSMPANLTRAIDRSKVRFETAYSKFLYILLLICADKHEPPTHSISAHTIKELTELSDLDPKTVRKSLKQLYSSGLIEDTGRRRGPGKNCIVKRVNWI